MTRITAKEFQTQFAPQKTHFKATRKANASGRAPHVAGRMNKLESAYAEHLKKLLFAGEIIHYEFEPFKLKLAKATFFKFDFLVIKPNGLIEIHEVKGHWEDDARVKWKNAAEKYWYLTLIAITSEDGIWTKEVYA